MKAMILAAGIGSRLGELSRHTPKCLTDINGTPMLRLVAENIARAGVTKVIINLHHLHEQVRSFASKSLDDLFEEVEFSYEPELLGTGGGLKQAAQFFQGERVFLMANADIYCSYNLALLTEALINNHDYQACLLVMKRKDSSYLKFTQQGFLSGWIKSADHQQSESLHKDCSSPGIFAFCGIQALSSDIFDFLQKEQRPSFSIIDTYMSIIRDAGKIICQDLGSDIWFDMGTPEQLQKLRDFRQSELRK